MYKQLTQIFCVLIFTFSIVQASEAVKGVKKDFENFKVEMSEKLDSVEKELKNLRSRTQKKGNEAHEKTIKELEESRIRLKSELNNMKESTSEGWTKLKKSFAKSVENLNSKIQKAVKD